MKYYNSKLYPLGREKIVLKDLMLYNNIKLLMVGY